MTEPLRLKRIATDGKSVAVLKPGTLVIVDPSAVELEGERDMGVIVRRDHGMVWVVHLHSRKDALPQVNKVTEVDALHYVATGLWQLGQPTGVEDRA